MEHKFNRRRAQSIPLLFALSTHYKSGSLHSAHLSGIFAYIDYRVAPKSGYESVAKFVFKSFPSVDFVDFGGLCYSRNLTK